jgi:hypothetical protein
MANFSRSRSDRPAVTAITVRPPQPTHLPIPNRHFAALRGQLPCGQQHSGGQIMGLLSKPIKNLDDLFVHTLQDILYAEQRITKALPKMIDKVSDPQLQNAFRSHLEETRNQIKRLEQVFNMHKAEAKAVTCPAIDGIIEEA